MVIIVVICMEWERQSGCNFSCSLLTFIDHITVADSALTVLFPTTKWHANLHLEKSY